MKKRVLLAITLAITLATLFLSQVQAQVNVPYDSVYPPADTSKGIKRYSDFPLDNIHILRLQEASKTLGGNVSSLQEEQKKFQEQQQQEISQMRSDIRSFEQSMIAQLNQLQKSMQKDEVKPVLEVPAPSEKYSPSVIALLGVNIILLLVVIILILWIRERYKTHKEETEEGHYHPAPESLVDYIKRAKRQKSLAEIRVELAKKGWQPSVIEHAIQASKEKKQSS